MASIKGNIILNSINTITGIIFPVITFPYAARILLPEGIGTVNFLNSIISYIVLLTSLGIPLYAVKEVAKYHDKKVQRDKITVEIIILSSILCFLGYIIVWALATFVPQINAQSSLFYILSLTIVFTSLGVNWFYQGVEDFKFITLRAIAVRTIAAAALFLFVKSPADLLIYGWVLVGSTVGNGVINFIHLRKYIDIGNISLKNINLSKHIGPTFQVFLLNILGSLYIQLNSIMLGFISGDESVGYFTAGTKISHIGLTLISSLSTVLLPRCTYLINSSDYQGFKSLIAKSINITLSIAMPMTLGLMILASPITIIFCGQEYADSIPVLIINAPIIIFISLTTITGVQILYPLDKIKIMMWSFAGAALMNIVLNLLLISKFGAVGASFSSLAAEVTVFFVQLYWGRQYYPFKPSALFNIKYVLGCLLMGACVFPVTLVADSNWSQLIIGVLIGVSVYTIYLSYIEAPIYTDVKGMILKKLKKY